MESCPSKQPSAMSWSQRFFLLASLFQSLHVTSPVTESEATGSNDVIKRDQISATSKKEALEKTRLPLKLPSIIEIKKALPNHCFESCAVTSIYFMIKDFSLIVAMYFLAEWTWPVLPALLKVALTPLFWLVQGTFFTAVFVVGHDGGHGSFSKHEWLNDLCGNFCHTFLMCPYYTWKLSHRNHHKNTANFDKDDVYYPVRENQGGKHMLLPGFGLGVGWFAYLLKGYSPRAVQHFNPLHPMFHQHTKQCLISLSLLVAWAACLYHYAACTSAGALVFHWVGPVSVFACYIVIITFLHHTEDEIPWYSNDVWDNVRGQLSSVDRHYGWCHYILHSITVHQIHHLFPIMPHYHLEEATVAFRKAFPDLVNTRSEPVMPAFWRMFKKYNMQSTIADDTKVHLYT